MADAVVMELQGNLTHLQDVFYMLETNGLTPAVLCFIIACPVGRGNGVVFTAR